MIIFPMRVDKVFKSSVNLELGRSMISWPSLKHLENSSHYILCISNLSLFLTILTVRCWRNLLRFFNFLTQRIILLSVFLRRSKRELGMEMRRWWCTSKRIDDFDDSVLKLDFGEFHYFLPIYSGDMVSNF